MLLLVSPTPTNPIENCDLVGFPHSLWGVVMSANNLTPRGLNQTISSKQDLENVGALDSFLLSKRSDSPREDQNYKYLLFVWNGKQASPLIKAYALTKGFELD